MKKKSVVGWTSLGLSLMMVLGVLVIPEKEVKAASYEFWGTAATIGCHTAFASSRMDQVDVSVNGRLITGSASSSVQQVMMLGSEVTCNGWRLTSCGGTGCQLH